MIIRHRKTGNVYESSLFFSPNLLDILIRDEKGHEYKDSPLYYEFYIESQRRWADFVDSHIVEDRQHTQFREARSPQEINTGFFA